MEPKSRRPRPRHLDEPLEKPVGTSRPKRIPLQRMLGPRIAASPAPSTGRGRQAASTLSLRQAARPGHLPRVPAMARGSWRGLLLPKHLRLRIRRSFYRLRDVFATAMEGEGYEGESHGLSSSTTRWPGRGGEWMGGQPQTPPRLASSSATATAFVPGTGRAFPLPCEDRASPAQTHAAQRAQSLLRHAQRLA